MVFESLVANLLNKYLSEFVDELTAKQLNLFAWNGNISLDNIAIKANAFDSLSLPFRVTHGHIARIEASFPWKSIYSSPVVIKLSDVYVLAVPNSETKYDDIKEELIEWNEKQKQLQKIEDAKQRSKESNSDEKKEDDGFAAKLAAQIVKNLQISITNVHICYEDQISWPNNPFQVGLTLHKLVFETQNDDQKTKSNDSVIYKLVTLEGLSFYWNCKQTEMLSKLEEQSVDEILFDKIANRRKTPDDLQYILWPINFTTNAVINRKPESDDYNSPLLDIQMDLDVFELRMTRMQFESLLLLLDAIDRMNLGKPYRKWRPSVPIRGHSKRWWRFAFTSIMETDIKRRTNNWSWNAIREHRIKMNRYQELYKQKLLSKNIDSIKSEIERLEKDLNLFSIVLARSQAEVETQQILKNKKDSPKKGWFSGWFSKEETKTEENIVHEFQKEMNPKEKQKLYEAIGYEEGIPEELPKDFIAHKIKFLINKLFITISDENRKITQLSLLGVGLDLSNRPSSHNLCVSNTVKSLYISGVDGIPLLEEQSAVDVLSLEFDMNPLDGQYDYGVIMRMSGFKLIYDSNTINTLVEMLSPPQDISFEDLQSIAAYRLQDFTQRTATGLEYAIGKHKQIKLNIDIEPSYVIIPQLGQLESAQNILLLSLGHVKLSSQLIPKTEIPKVRDLITSHSDYELILKMRKMAYESYKCHISEVQMILSDAHNWQNDMKSLSTDRHLLYPVEFNLSIERSIIPNDPHLAKLKVEGHLPNIELKISDKQLTNLMNLLMTLPFGKSDDQKSEEIDGLKPLKAAPRRVPIIESSKIVSAAIDLVKERVNQFEESLKNVSQDVTKEESDGEKSIIVHKSVIFDFKLKEIVVSLFQGPNRSSEFAIAFAKLNKFEVSGEVLTDSTLSVNCHIGDLCLTDVRTSRSNNGIKTLFERNKLISSSSVAEENDSIFSISFTQKSNERLVVITISGFRLILALDYLLNLSNIITKAFDSDSSSEAIAPKSDEKTSEKPTYDVSKAVERAQQLSSSVPKTEVTNILHFNLNKMEIVLLESIEVINAPAIIMGCHSSINLIQNPNHIKLYGEVSNISALLTNYELYIGSQEIDAFIMRPTNLVFNGSLSGEEQMLDITFSEIQLFISPPMVNIVLNILSKMGSSAEKSDSLETEDSDPSKLFKIRPNDTNIWYLSYVPVAEEATEDFVDGPEKTVISTKQQIYLNMKSINVIIESGGLDSQPLIKMNSYFHGKLVGYKSLTANCSLIADYHNENNFFWEPLIEPIEGQTNPWDFEMKVLLEESGKIDVKIESNEQLEMTITKTSIDVLTSLSEAFTNAIAKQLPPREENVVIVRNFLGFDLRLFMQNSSLKTRSMTNNTKIKAIESESLIIKTEEEMSLIASDIKEVDINIGLMLSDEEEIHRRITCHGHTIRCYNLPKKSYPTNEFWKWIVEVEDIDAFTKTITFKSNAQIVNQFNTALDIYCLKRDQPLLLGRVNPLSTLALPMDAVYGQNCELKVKPSDGYTFSDKTIDWRNAVDRRNSAKLCLPLCDSSGEPLILVSQSESDPQNKFYVKVRSDNKEVFFEDTHKLRPESILHQIKLIPIVRLRNLLPYRITYAIEGIDQLVTLEQGHESDLSTIKLGETGVALNLIDYLERDWHCFRKIPSHGDDNDIHLWKFTASSHDTSLSLDLAVKLSIESHTLVVSLFAPFWMINRTSQQLVYRIDDETVLYHAPTVMSPVLLSFKPKSFFCKKKLFLSIGDSKFSDGFSIDVVGSKGNVIAKSRNGKYNYYVSVDIQLSRIGLSKIVTITPFYSIVNISKTLLEISEDNDEWFKAESMESTAFWPKQSKDQNIYLRLNSDSLSSKPLSLSKSSSTLIRVDKQYFYVDIDISEWEAIIKISDYFEGSAPVLLVNALNASLSYGQKGVTVWSSKTGEQKHVNTLPANHSVLYTWYLPSGEQTLVWKYEDLICEEQSIDLKCDNLLDVNDVFIVSFLDGKQRVVLFTNEYLSASHALQAGEITNPKINVEFVMKGIGLSIVNNEAKKDLLYIAITSSVLWEIREMGSKRYKPLSVKSIDAIESLHQKVVLKKRVGENLTLLSDDSFKIDFTDSESPKLIAPKSGQLRRLSNRGIWISVAMSEHIIQCHMKVHRLQIDNQMPDHIFGIVMCPVAPPKTIAQDFSPKSFIEFSSIIQKQPTITRFKYNTFLIQEFLLQIDRGLLSSIQELLAVAVKKESNDKLIDEDITDILQPKNNISESLSSRKTYYDKIDLSPIKVHVSFSLGGSSGGLSDLPLGLDFIVRSAGVTLTEFNDVVFRLDCFRRENLLVENSELTSIVVKHYTTQVLKQFYKLVLGLDLIGNPMKLVLGLKDGVGDFFYEPFQGIIQGPGEFAEGLQIGVKSLTSNVVGGVSGALGSITNTLGEGVSALTMDDKFRRERRSRINRKVGFAESGKNLFKGVFKGVTGVITQPIEGAREDGFEGLFKGVGRGVVGIVAQPTSGVIDFTSGTLNALKRAVDPKQEAKQMRPSRYVGPDGKLRPYNKHYAIGYTILKEMENGKYSTDIYLIHRNLNANTLIMLTHKRLLCIKRGVISNNWETDWSEEWHNCDKVTVSADRLKIKITLKEQKKMFGIFSGDSDRIIATNSLDSTQWLLEKIDKQLKR